MTIKQQGGVFGRNPTFNDVTVENNLNVDGSVTGASFASSGNMTFGDGDKAVFGASSDLQIYHDGSNSWVDEQGTGSLVLRGSGQILLLAAGNDESMAAFVKDGGTYLYHNGIQKLETISSGVSISGNVVVPSGSGIDFSATAGTGTSELFDDYEEGTWTPSTFTNWSTAPTVGNATYTKIGRQVTVRMQGLNGVASVNAKIAGLPYTSASSSTAVFKNLSVGDYSIGVLPDSQTQIDSMAAVDFTGTFWAMTCTYFV
jgi:hypothetical protein